jgi:hypothetical protein
LRHSESDAVEEYRDVGMDVIDLGQVHLTIETLDSLALSARRRITVTPVRRTDGVALAADILDHR